MSGDTPEVYIRIKEARGLAKQEEMDNDLILNQKLDAPYIR